MVEAEAVEKEVEEVVEVEFYPLHHLEHQLEFSLPSSHPPSRRLRQRRPSFQQASFQLESFLLRRRRPRVLPARAFRVVPDLSQHSLSELPQAQAPSPLSPSFLRQSQCLAASPAAVLPSARQACLVSRPLDPLFPPASFPRFQLASSPQVPCLLDPPDLLSRPQRRSRPVEMSRLEETFHPAEMFQRSNLLAETSQKSNLLAEMCQQFVNLHPAFALQSFPSVWLLGFSLPNAQATPTTNAIASTSSTPSWSSNASMPEDALSLRSTLLFPILLAFAPNTSPRTLALSPTFHQTQTWVHPQIRKCLSFPTLVVVKVRRLLRTCHPRRTSLRKKMFLSLLSPMLVVEVVSHLRRTSHQRKMFHPRRMFPFL